MRMLVLGAGGQVGGAVLDRAGSVGCEAIGLGHGDLDIADPQAVSAAIDRYQPTHIINAAAYNAVDKAEDEPRAAFLVNALGPAHLALAAREADAIIVHYSSDYVFDGAKDGPYTEDDQPNPLSTYGRSKFLGEQAVASICEKHYVVRTSWVFAPGGNNFVSRLLPRLKAGEALRFIDDQRVAPTYAADIARATVDLIKLNAPFGTYHAAGSEAYTPYEWARAVAEKMNAQVAIEPVASSAFATRARRPAQSILSNVKLDKLGVTMSCGRERLDEYFAKGDAS